MNIRIGVLAFLAMCVTVPEAISQTQDEAAAFIRATVITCKEGDTQLDRVTSMNLDGASFMIQTGSAKWRHALYWRLSAGEFSLEDDVIRFKCSVPGCVTVPGNDARYNSGRLVCGAGMAPRLMRALQFYQSGFAKEKSNF